MIIFVVVAVVVTSVLYATGTDQPESGTIPQDISAANNKFTIDFYKQVSDNNSENIFFSPINMYVAFSALYEGARENTATELSKVFGFESDETIRHNSTAYLMSSINRDDPYATLEMANAMWLADTFEPYESYLDIAHKTYLADIERVDFPDPNDGVKKINDWAAEKTNDKITKVITPLSVDSSTAMVMTNAIYFKGTWSTQFPVENTAESDFYKNNAESTSADYMNVVGAFNYTRSDGAQVLKMSYKGDRLSMLVILPDDRDGIDKLENDISVQQIEKWVDELTNSPEVIVSMPKFETRTKYDLNKHLLNMGISDVFDGYKSDLSGIMSTEFTNLFVSKASQDAYVKINEEGTEAAAVTTIIASTISVPPPPPRFIADHPFIFIIQDDESGTILFMGRMSDPSI